jgi:hypothetical protein
MKNTETSQKEFWLSKLPNVRRIFEERNELKAIQLASKRLTSHLDKHGIEALYYITPVDNLKSIINEGILSHEQMKAKRHLDISMPEVNARRARKEPIHKRPIHSYVPLYFNPLNPMLYKRRNEQKSLAILRLNRGLIFKDGALISDGNAASFQTKFLTVSELDSVDWGCVFANYWNDHPDGKRIRCAEVLVPDHVYPRFFESINCNNFELLDGIRELNRSSLPINIDRSLFF